MGDGCRSPAGGTGVGVGAAHLPRPPRAAEVSALKAEFVVERKPRRELLGTYIKIPFVTTQDSKAQSQPATLFPAGPEQSGFGYQPCGVPMRRPAQRSRRLQHPHSPRPLLGACRGGPGCVTLVTFGGSPPSRGRSWGWRASSSPSPAPQGWPCLWGCAPGLAQTSRLLHGCCVLAFRHVFSDDPRQPDQAAIKHPSGKGHRGSER